MQDMPEIQTRGVWGDLYGFPVFVSEHLPKQKVDVNIYRRFKPGSRKGRDKALVKLYVATVEKTLPVMVHGTFVMDSLTIDKVETAQSSTSVVDYKVKQKARFDYYGFDYKR